MDKSEFNKLLSSFQNEKSSVDSRSKKLLETLAHKHPYFTAPQVIRMKALNSGEPFQLERLITSSFLKDILQFELPTRLSISAVSKFENLLDKTNHQLNSYKEHQFDANYMISAVDSTIKQEVGKDYLDLKSLYDEEIERSNKKEKARSFQEWLKIYDGKENKGYSDDIVDRFVAENPKIEPNKAKFFSPENKAKESIVEDYSMVSETLADTHIKQNNKLEAKKIYQVLIKKFPEKSGYFASKIKKLD